MWKGPATRTTKGQHQLLVEQPFFGYEFIPEETNNDTSKAS
jgi:hypothetical protein